MGDNFKRKAARYAMPAQPVCASCGHQNRSDARYCSQCGHRLPRRQAAYPASAQSHRRQPTRAGGTILVVIGAVLVAMGVMAMGTGQPCMFCGSSILGIACIVSGGRR